MKNICKKRGEKKNEFKESIVCGTKHSDCGIFACVMRR